jgi:Spy/CpxP family protein refolding chaperone
MGLIAGSVAIGAVAYASPGHEGWRGHGGFGGGFGPVMRTLQPAQRDQIHTMFAADRANAKTLHEQVRTARETLFNALINGQDPTAAETQVNQAQAAMTADRVKLAQQVRGVLTTAQIQQLQTFHTQWKSLMDQQRNQREQLMNQLGGGTGSGGGSAVE